MGNEVARPRGVEPPTFWFVASHGQNPDGLFGVAYESRNAEGPSTQRVGGPGGYHRLVAIYQVVWLGTGSGQSLAKRDLLVHQPEGLIEFADASIPIYDQDLIAVTRWWREPTHFSSKQVCKGDRCGIFPVRPHDLNSDR